MKMYVSKKHRSRSRGFVLVCVLWILVIMTLIAVGFGRRAILARQAVQYDIDQYKAMNVARGAVERGIAEMRLNFGKYASGVQTRDLFSPSLVDGEDCGYDYIYANTRINVNCIHLGNPSYRVLRHLLRDVPGAIELYESFHWGGSIEEPQYGFFTTAQEFREVCGIPDGKWLPGPNWPGLRNLIDVNAPPHDGRFDFSRTPSILMTILMTIVADMEQLDLDVWQAARDYGDSIERFRGSALYAGLVEDKIEFGEWDEAEADRQYGILQAFCMDGSDFITIVGIASQRRGQIVAKCQAWGRLSVVGHIEQLQWREGPLEWDYKVIQRLNDEHRRSW